MQRRLHCRLRALLLSAEAGGPRAGRRRCFSLQLPSARFQFLPIVETASGSADAACFSPFNRYFAPSSLPLLSTPFADGRRAVWPNPPRQPTPKPSPSGRACRFLNETNRGAPSAREACLVFGGAPGFHWAKKRMANGHSLIPQFLPAPRRRQPISSKTGPTPPPASRHALRKRLQVAPANNQPAGRAGNFSMRPAKRLERRTQAGNRTRNRTRKERMGNG